MAWNWDKIGNFWEKFPNHIWHLMRVISIKWCISSNWNALSNRMTRYYGIIYKIYSIERVSTFFSYTIPWTWVDSPFLRQILTLKTSNSCLWFPIEHQFSSLSHFGTSYSIIEFQNEIFLCEYTIIWKSICSRNKYFFYDSNSESRMIEIKLDFVR